MKAALSTLFFFLSSGVASALSPQETACLARLHPNIALTREEVPVSREVKRLGSSGGPYELKTVSFSNARYLRPVANGCPALKGFETHPSLIFDASAVNEGIGPGNAYAGNTYGSADVQRAIQAYLKTKQFDDGVLDIFLQVRPGDTYPNADVSRMYESVARFGAKRGVAFRNGEEVKGMKRNPAHRRHVRIFMLGTAPHPERGDVPVELFREASAMANEFDIQVAVTARYVTVKADGQVSATDTDAWVLFFPEKS